MLVRAVRPRTNSRIYSRSVHTHGCSQGQCCVCNSRLPSRLKSKWEPTLLLLSTYMAVLVRHSLRIFSSQAIETSLFSYMDLKEEAARVAEEAKFHLETGRCSDGNRFSARHSSREHGHHTCSAQQFLLRASPRQPSNCLFLE